jgi:hypothetical protein
MREGGDIHESVVIALDFNEKNVPFASSVFLHPILVLPSLVWFSLPLAGLGSFTVFLLSFLCCSWALAHVRRVFCPSAGASASRS